MCLAQEICTDPQEAKSSKSFIPTSIVNTKLLTDYFLCGGFWFTLIV